MSGQEVGSCAKSRGLPHFLPDNNESWNLCLDISRNARNWVTSDQKDGL